jgi:hypothetical protein
LPALRRCQGTPRRFLADASARLLLLATSEGATAGILVVATGTEIAVLIDRGAHRQRPAGVTCLRPGFFNALLGPVRRCTSRLACL